MTSLLDKQRPLGSAVGAISAIIPPGSDQSRRCGLCSVDSVSPPLPSASQRSRSWSCLWQVATELQCFFGRFFSESNCLGNVGETIQVCQGCCRAAGLSVIFELILVRNALQIWSASFSSLQFLRWALCSLPLYRKSKCPCKRQAGL